jgi:hypothetical protein
MKNYLDIYKKQSVSVFPTDGNLLIALFEKLKEHLIQADFFINQKESEKFAQSMGKALKVIDVICAGVNPLEKVDGEPLGQGPNESPWGNYFATLVYILNDATLTQDSVKIKRAIDSVDQILAQLVGG